MENDAATPDLILDAAEALFARQGFPATTIKQIGTAAGVNPALIYYYFGDKEKLYRALLKRLFGRMVSGAGGSIAAGGVAPEAAVRGLIGFQSALLISNPNLPPLIVRELLDHQAAHAGEGIAELAANVFGRLRDLIAAGQEAGVFRRDLDPLFCAISAISLVPYLHLARPAVGLLMGHGPEGPTRDEMEAYSRHAAEFVLSALAARPDDSSHAAPDGDRSGSGSASDSMSAHSRSDEE
jgi:TetR/AcrR family transcriptional regulator